MFMTGAQSRARAYNRAQANMNEDIFTSLEIQGPTGNAGPGGLATNIKPTRTGPETQPRMVHLTGMITVGTATKVRAHLRNGTAEVQVLMNNDLPLDIGLPMFFALMVHPDDQVQFQFDTAAVNIREFYVAEVLKEHFG